MIVPSTITQGDSLTWKLPKGEYNPATVTASCFIRGQSALDLTGNAVADGWEFVISSAQSNSLTPGLHKIQIVVYNDNLRKTLSTDDLLVCPSFENLTKFDPRSDDEKELEKVTSAIATIASGGISEYEIKGRRARYQDLNQLTQRQEYLRRRVAIAKGRIKPGGKNVGVRFGSYRFGG